MNKAIYIFRVLLGAAQAIGFFRAIADQDYFWAAIHLTCLVIIIFWKNLFVFK